MNIERVRCISTEYMSFDCGGIYEAFEEDGRMFVVNNFGYDIEMSDWRFPLPSFISKDFRVAVTAITDKKV